MDQAKANSGLQPESLVVDMERRIHALQEELAESRRLALMGVAAGYIVHEINNVLCPISVAVQTALAGSANAESVKSVMIRAAAGIDRVTCVADSIMRLIQGARAETSATADVEAAVNQAMSCLARPLETDGISTIVLIDAGCQATMEQVLLEQVFLNLILNARRAMAAHGGQLSILASHDTKQITIIVADTGCGMPEPSDSSSGFGLGICRRLVNHAQGTIAWGTNDDGIGTRVVICLSKS